MQRRAVAFDLDDNVRNAKFRWIQLLGRMRGGLFHQNQLPFLSFPLSLTVPLGRQKCPSVQWGVSLFVRGGKEAFDKYKTPSLSHFGIFGDFPKQMSWKIH